MDSSLAIFSLLTIFFNIDCTLAQCRAEVVQHTSEHCKPINQTHTTVHGRMRRCLIYGKGASLSMTISSVKDLTGGALRGFNLISEETLSYELPSSVAIPKVGASKAVPSKPTPIPMDAKTKLKHRSSYISPRYSPYYMQRRDAETDGSSFDSQDLEMLFFKQIFTLAKTCGYNGRHCIMRTICEAQHFLYPRGQSLFHDIIRIILVFALPSIRSNKKYSAALNTANPLDCANLYGPHCRISFLDYFTRQIYGKLM